ncbi:hypothetical protein EET67_09940 [Pseudaminobacter arsenicus]|uniref:Uncharacterized protein n=1 Tax=Borborobacter arsenicus TaxID=1851146 RepID=A0A432V6Y4_9HYPH|nr:hypothetical protein [Pseudaminobacter arsenicus]RUM97926.1 hypothetical protein EET67_09940 [Pseudaminobacter arsenicus]
MNTPDRFDIRVREYNFGSAPRLDGETAWYRAMTSGPDNRLIESPIRFRRAIEAAQEAARMDYDRCGGELASRSAIVATGHIGPRPAGTPRHLVRVSYRPRFR